MLEGRVTVVGVGPAPSVKRLALMTQIAIAELPLLLDHLGAPQLLEVSPAFSGTTHPQHVALVTALVAKRPPAAE